MSYVFDVPECPHCGSWDAVVSNERAYGWAERQFFQEGSELLIDGVHYSNTKTLRCGKCYKIRRDIERVGNGVAVTAAWKNNPK